MSSPRLNYAKQCFRKFCSTTANGWWDCPNAEKPFRRRTAIRIPRLCVSATTLCAHMSNLYRTWPSGSQNAIGEAGEFLVWAPLIIQSGGGLHVFLPVLDRGLDALIHRLAAGAYLALQVKTKTYMNGPEAVIAVYEKHLFTPDQLVIGVHLDGDHLGPFVLVADAAT